MTRWASTGQGRKTHTRAISVEGSELFDKKLEGVMLSSSMLSNSLWLMFMLIYVREQVLLPPDDAHPCRLDREGDELQHLREARSTWKTHLRLLNLRPQLSYGII